MITTYVWIAGLGMVDLVMITIWLLYMCGQLGYVRFSNDYYMVTIYVWVAGWGMLDLVMITI